MVFFGTEVRWCGTEVEEILHVYTGTSIGDGHTLEVTKEGNGKDGKDGKDGDEPEADTAPGAGTTAEAGLENVPSSGIAGLHEPDQLHIKTSGDRWEPWFQETRDDDLEGANPAIEDLEPRLDDEPTQHERAKRGEERQQALVRARTFFENMIEGIKELLVYDPEHPRVQELPANGPRHLKSMVDWELKRQELLKTCISRTTITERRGQVYA